MFSHEVNSSVINHTTQPSQRLQLLTELVKKEGGGGGQKGSTEEEVGDDR